ncbi:MAG: DNA replication/repair protein RecF [Acetobacteraceae bacterium]
MPAAQLRLQRLALHQFRSYASLVWHPDRRISVITGPNGAGKTNLLEAVSLLGPGRGLRGARVAEFSRFGPDGDGTWAVAGRFQHPIEGLLEIATGTAAEGLPERRIFRLDGRPVAQAAAARRIAVAWLTPEMGRLFQEGAAARRRFLDRLVYSLEPGHARELAGFEAAMTRRNRLLAGPAPDPAWLAGLEEAMARHGVAVAAARRLLTIALTRVLPAAAPGFPGIELTLAGAISERLASHPALAVEEWLAWQLAARRPADKEAGGASLGVHRSDLIVRIGAMGMPANRASTGEQKVLLLSLVLAEAALLAERYGFAPLLLLDEPLANLDGARRAALFAILAAMNSQVLLTGTDAEPFRPLASQAEFLRAGASRLVI